MRRLFIALAATLSLAACGDRATPPPIGNPPVTGELPALDEAAAIRVEQRAAALANAAAIAIAQGVIPADRIDAVVVLRNTAQAWVARSRVAYDLRNASEYDDAVAAAGRALDALRDAVPGARL